jgi:hypothetical protein
LSRKAEGEIIAKFLSNAFALQMLDTTVEHNVKVTPVTAADVPAEAVSVIGHADTAAVVSGLLGREVPANRASISLAKGDVLYVAQVTGGRLPEGCTTLPEGMHLAFLRVDVD